ncbi:hypothetical protein BDW22DRAFT_1388565 [Trametopsis cervina]|nr:hypothetical protein BDW22DRAFT_1388565 [Trametopsis cervina]
MFSKLFFALSLVLGLTLQVSAHAAITPQLGVNGTPVRNDVQRPSTQSPCGNVNIAQTINTSQAAQLQASGSFVATIHNFNAGVDGSREITKALVDPTGTGKNFVAATVTKNGIKAPTDVSSQQLTVQLPAGTKCTGGSGKNTCLVSLTTAGGFGNCVAVKSGAAAAPAANNAAKQGKGKRDARAYGSRAARAMRRAMEEIQEWM